MFFVAVRVFIFILCSRSIIDVGCWLFKDLVFLGALLYLPLFAIRRKGFVAGIGSESLDLAVFIVLHVSAVTLKH